MDSDHKTDRAFNGRFGQPATKSKTKTFGEVELRYISVGDLSFFAKLLDKAKDDREFVIQVLYHQLITPKVSFTEFNGIPDDELMNLARDFIRHEEHTFEYFKETNDAEFFSNFRASIETYNQKRVEQLRAAVEPMIESSRRILESFSRQNADILKQIMPSYITEQIKGLSTVAEMFREYQLRIAESLRPVLEQYQLTARIVSETLAPQINFWKNWAEQYRAIFASYTKFWQDFQEQYKIAEEEAIQILRKYKWFITPSLPFDFVFEAIRIGRRKGNQRKTMNRLFIEYFSSDNFRNLENLVEEWKANDLFDPRMKIFRDCVCVMRNAKAGYNPSNIVLPSLIAQIDGIRIEFMNRNGLSFRAEENVWKGWFKGQIPNQKLLDLANDIFLNILFQRAQPGKPLENPFTFSRHKIMHGEYLRYGRIDNTIRAFLILDFLATISSRDKP